MKTELNAIQPKVVFRGSLFFASLYIFKVGLYLTGFIDFSLLLNLLGFTAVCLYFKHKYLNKLYRTIAVILTFALFYHDSYLPSVEQMIAQRNNLTDFSLGYIVEFIEGFINLKNDLCFYTCDHHFVFFLKICKSNNGYLCAYYGNSSNS